MNDPVMHVRDGQHIQALRYTAESRLDVLRWLDNHGDEREEADGKLRVPAIGAHSIAEVGAVELEFGDYLTRTQDGHWGRAPGSEFS